MPDFNLIINIWIYIECITLSNIKVSKLNKVNNFKFKTNWLKKNDAALAKMMKKLVTIAAIFESIIWQRYNNEIYSPLNNDNCI